MTSSDTPGTAAGVPGDQVTVEQLADDLAAIVRAVPGVAGLHPGVLGEIGTYLPGRRVAGIRLRDEAFSAAVDPHDPVRYPVEVHVVLSVGAPVRETAEAVHVAVAERLAAAGLHPTVLVNVADIAADLTTPTS